jgi:hypothetical protein
MISSVERRTDPLSRSRRVALGLLAIGLLAPSLVASRLTPDRLGYGTHRQLGLPPCGFLTQLKIRCPTCGMTTAWSHAVRGEWTSAASASAAGTLLAALTWVGAAWAAVTAALGRALVRIDLRTGLVVATIVAAMTLLEWLCRLTAG